MKNCKAILLDIDNTIYEYKSSHEFAINFIYKEISIKYSIKENVVIEKLAIAKELINRDLVNTASSHNRLLYFQKCLELLNVNALRDSLYLYNLYWDKFIQKIKIENGVYEFFELNAHKKIVLLTDLTVDIQYKKIKHLKLDNYASYIVSSEEVGVEKPHPFIFLYALNKINLQIDEVCMIGDSFEKDIKGATRLGILSYWLKREKGAVVENNKIIPFYSFKELNKYF